MTEYITSEHVLSNLANLPQLVFEVTDACNLKCKYCAYGEFYSDFDKREDNMLSVSKAIRLIDYLNQYWNSERNTSAKSFMYISFYGGEPLMNFNFIKEIVEYVETRLDCPRRKFLFSMTTNAMRKPWHCCRPRPIRCRATEPLLQPSRPTVRLKRTHCSKCSVRQKP